MRFFLLSGQGAQPSEAIHCGCGRNHCGNINMFASWCYQPKESEGSSRGGQNHDTLLVHGGRWSVALLINASLAVVYQSKWRGGYSSIGTIKKHPKSPFIHVKIDLNTKFSLARASPSSLFLVWTQKEFRMILLFLSSPVLITPVEILSGFWSLIKCNFEGASTSTVKNARL